MTKEQTPETTKSGKETAAEKRPEPRPNLYQKQVAFYRNRLAEGFEKGFERYGFALFHSIPAEEQVLIEKDLAMPRREAADHYNLGNALAARGEYPEAIKCWKQAQKLKPELHDATFNIALALELSGNLSDARKYFETYLETPSGPEERRLVEEHLARMKK